MRCSDSKIKLCQFSTVFFHAYIWLTVSTTLACEHPSSLGSAHLLIRLDLSLQHCWWVAALRERLPSLRLQTMFVKMSFKDSLLVTYLVQYSITFCRETMYCMSILVHRADGLELLTIPSLRVVKCWFFINYNGLQWFGVAKSTLPTAVLSSRLLSRLWHWQ